MREEARILIDVNLPSSFPLWSGDDYLHVSEIDPSLLDSRIWDYAKSHGLTIVTKDRDFSDRILVSVPPPRVIHIRLGNIRLKEFMETIVRHWPLACELSNTHRIVQVFEDRLEAIE
ncbi:MAG: DUF5615 family PIN-like protein [Ignavibacteriae bacterium]|nr:DUF5615 family PIN-like protein [Ignavibacteriota bacterium]